jgi:hypothetical protein
MGTYPLKQIMTEYANGHMTPEMALGHTLQHLEQLYEAQTAANLSRYDLRSQVDTLDSRVSVLQTALAALKAVVEKCRKNDGRRVTGEFRRRSLVIGKEQMTNDK